MPEALKNGVQNLIVSFYRFFSLLAPFRLHFGAKMASGHAKIDHFEGKRLGPHEKKLWVSGFIRRPDVRSLLASLF